MSDLTLPIELMEHAIDFLRDDEDTLKATSLVCKALLPRSRLNLFRIIVLCLPGHLDRLVELLSDAPHVAAYVDEIEITENSLVGLLRPSMAIAARLPLVLGAHPLVQPRRLAVHNQLWVPTRYNPDYLESLSQLSTIISLELCDVAFTTVADFSIILHALPRLTSLTAKHLDCQRRMDAATASDVGCVLPSLTTLCVESSHPTEVVDWLFKCNAFPPLRKLECEYELSTRGDGQALGALWANTGATLEDISLRISKRSVGARLPLEVIEAQLDLSACEALQTLRIDCRQERGVVPDWTWLAWLLSHLECRTLRSVTFAFESSSHALASMHVFSAELDSVLASAPFAHALQEVVFDFDYGPDAADPDDEHFLEMFPILRSMNLLRVS